MDPGAHLLSNLWALAPTSASRDGSALKLFISLVIYTFSPNIESFPVAYPWQANSIASSMCIICPAPSLNATRVLQTLVSIFSSFPSEPLLKQNCSPKPCLQPQQLLHPRCTSAIISMITALSWYNRSSEQLHDYLLKLNYLFQMGTIRLSKVNQGMLVKGHNISAWQDESIVQHSSPGEYS